MPFKGLSATLEALVNVFMTQADHLLMMIHMYVAIYVQVLRFAPTTFINQMCNSVEQSEISSTPILASGTNQNFY